MSMQAECKPNSAHHSERQQGIEWRKKARHAKHTKQTAGVAQASPPQKRIVYIYI